MTNLSRIIHGLLCFGLAVPAFAGTLLSVSGPPDSGAAIGSGEAYAVAFTLNRGVTNFAVSAPITCIGCTGGVWLHRSLLGPTASFADALGAEVFNASAANIYFTLPTLGPGLYFLIVSVDSGSAVWQGSSTVTAVSDGATRELDLFASSTTSLVPRSSFSAAFGTGLNYEISGSPVPEPGTAGLLLVACVPFVLRRMRRSKG